MKEQARIRLLVTIAACLLVALLVTACGSPTPAPTAVPPTAVPPTAVPTAAPTKPPTAAPAKPAVDVKAIEAAYKLSSHSNDWGEGRGPNTYCARCHSPRNWDPKAVPGPAANCFACKFPTDKGEMRVPPPNTNVFVAQKDWKNIGCDVCHKVENNVVDPKPVAWNQATGKYDAVATTTELCEKCHTNSLGGSMHKLDVGGGAHSNQAGTTKHRPDQCTDCHDPHSAKASCLTCHADVMKPEKKIQGHDAAHANVTCQACHDNGWGITVGPWVPGTSAATIDAGHKWVGSVGPSDPKNPTSKWITFRLSAPTGTTKYPFVSHQLRLKVDCKRCHNDTNAKILRSFVTPTPVPTARPITTTTTTTTTVPMASPTAPRPSPSPTK